MLACSFRLRRFYLMTIKKQILDLELSANEPLSMGNHLLKLRPQPGQSLPPMYAGQFVQIQIPNGSAMLRRPISVCNVIDNELWLLIARVGRGTIAITDLSVGDKLNLILPLGNTFSTSGVSRPLLVGGGVGIAPMLMLARTFSAVGIKPDVLLGGRTSGHIVLRNEFEAVANTYYTTEDDGSLGVHGRVTDHPILSETDHERIYSCGPMPMMRAIATLAKERQIECEVSLENTMACGIGACLCCVQDTHTHGNICVCTEGPVFNSEKIKW